MKVRVNICWDGLQWYGSSDFPQAEACSTDKAQLIAHLRGVVYYAVALWEVPPTAVAISVRNTTPAWLAT